MGRMFNDQEKHSQKAPDEQDIQPASQRQRHGGRGRAHRRLPIASRTRARDPRAPTCGHAQMLPMRRTLARLRPRRRRAPLAWPGFRLLVRRTGRRHDARGLPEVRNHGRAGTVGRARVEVHPGLRGQDRRLLRAPVHQRRARGRRQRHPKRQTTGERLQEHELLRHHDLPDLRQTRPQSRHHRLTITHHKQRIAKVLKPAGSIARGLGDDGIFYCSMVTDFLSRHTTPCRIGLNNILHN